MRLLSILFFLLTLTSGTAQVSLGIGLVRISFNETTVLKLYEQTDINSMNKKLEFFNDPKDNRFDIKDLEKQKIWLKPEKLWLDYSELTFRCKSKKAGWLEVIVNNGTGATYWLEQSLSTKFETWEEYLKEMFAVNRRPDVKQKIRVEATTDAKAIDYKGQDCFRVRKMKGDWIEIFSAGYCDKSSTKIESGWIKWREGNKLLIEYFSTS